MNVDEYLKRIKSENLKEVNLENLTKLQHNHNLYVTFEFCELHSGRKPVGFSLSETFERVMHQSRGGWCFQLNPLFHWLLTQLGYDCFFVPIDSYNHDTAEHYSRPLHIGIIVRLDNTHYFVDTCSSGYVDEPLEVKIDIIQKKPSGTYRFVHDAEGRFCLQASRKDTWAPIYDFHLTPQPLEDFKSASDYAQSPAYPCLYMRSILSKYTETGYIRLVGCVFSVFTKKDGILVDRKDTRLTREQAIQCAREIFQVNIDDTFDPIDEVSQHVHV